MVIALTGGIAAGKTQVSDRFAARGVPVIDTDQLAREVIAPGTEGLAAVRSTFGEAIMNADGTVNRQALSERIFADADARRKLEAITHPRIRARVSAALRELEAPYALVVIPLLAETGWQDLADRVLVVDAPASLQRARLMQREQIDADQAARRLASQASREQRLAIADEVIDNTATPEALDDAVSALDRQYRAIADKNR
ncbi:dephospho-CoA kinase [Spiribacter salinus]|nr:dephospho-CoA kinase [Spiribacter salinus]